MMKIDPIDILAILMLWSLVWTGCSGNPIGPVSAPLLISHIEVRTVDASGASLPHVALEVTDSHGQGELLVTDSAGQSTLPVPPVDVTAWMPGYEPVSAHITSSSYTFVLVKGN